MITGGGEQSQVKLEGSVRWWRGAIAGGGERWQSLVESAPPIRVAANLKITCHDDFLHFEKQCY